MLTEYALRSAFWLTETVQGRPISRHSADIEHLLNDTLELRLGQQLGLQELIEFVTEHVPRYRHLSKHSQLSDSRHTQSAH